MLHPSYTSMVRLMEPFQPHGWTEAITPLDAAVTALSADPRIRNTPSIHATADEKRHWLRGVLTLRPAGQLSDDLLAATDALLQQELAKKTLTDANDLPRLTGGYPSAAQVSIWDGDISTLQIGAIVNAANAQMEGCFQPFHACIDNVIHNAAGPRLREDCHAIMQVQGRPEATGDAKITRAYNLPSDFVIHTVGPIVPGGKTPDQADAEALARCYRSCLDLAASVGVDSIAFCGISTGVFGYPADLAAQVALDAVASWLSDNKTSVSHVVFNTYGDAATKIYTAATQNWTHHDTA